MKSIKQRKAEALVESEALQTQIQDLLKQIKTGLENHDRQASIDGGHHWGHVGDLTDIAHTLNDIKDRLHHTGEYATIN